MATIEHIKVKEADLGNWVMLKSTALTVYEGNEPEIGQIVDFSGNQISVLFNDCQYPQTVPDDELRWA